MSFTVHDIPPELNARLSKEARARGISKNRFVKEVLAEAVGLPAENGYADEYGEFCGVWTAAETADFEASLRDNRRVEPEDW